MITSGIDRCFISVADMDKALAFYRNIIGLQVIAEGNLGSDILHTLWGLPNHVSGRSICLRNTRQLTSIELIQLKPIPVEASRDRASSYDYGLIDVCFLISNTTRVQKIFEKKGYGIFSPPYHYPPWPSGSDIIEGFNYGPSKEVIACVEYLKPPVVEQRRLDGDFWTMMDMAQIVDDMEKALVFYRDALGLQLVSDATLPPGFLDDVLRFPKNTKARIVLLNHPESNGPVVEILETSAKGKAMEQSPLEAGIFMLSFESNDLNSDIDRIKSKGFSILSGPADVKTALHSTVKAVDIGGPGKIRIELFQKQ